MVIIIERELGSYNEADLIKEIAFAKLQERKRILRMALKIAVKLPDKYQDKRKKHLIAIEVASQLYSDLKKYLEIV